MDEARFTFERFTLPLKGEIHRAARALTGNDADALDLTQEAYLRAWRAFPSYRENERFRPWFFTILRHAHVDACRRRKVRPATVDPGEMEEPAAPPSTDGLSEEMQAALERLRPAHHLLLLLRHAQG
ncbi:MAG TPA: RNA polymerase sigma factor, partial [Planctomycetota bacterium]|nr:RNA polymerase sigma factor [Planctomycetota bacterium]